MSKRGARRPAANCRGCDVVARSAEVVTAGVTQRDAPNQALSENDGKSRPNNARPVARWATGGQNSFRPQPEG